jgi:anti-sigma-K factor RskA
VSDFDELVGGEDLGSEEAARLRRVHDLLVQAGPPPDLPPALDRPEAEQGDAEIVQFPLLPRRRWAVAAIAAALLALVAFGGGYLVGHNKAKPAAFSTHRVVIMHGSTGTAVLRLGKRDSAGNWQMEMEVTGLAEQKNQDASYGLWLTHDGKPTVPCGWFRVHDKTTTVRFSVPYHVSDGDGWAVTSEPANATGAGAIVLTT